MCGRFDLTLPPGRVAEAYRAEVPEAFASKPRYNIAPTQEVPIVIGGGDGVGRRLVSARFGLRPDWWTLPSDLINIRVESLTEKPYFARLVRTQRCVVPVTGFFEWYHEGRRRTPFRFVPRAGGLLSMAGLYLVNDFGYRKSYAFAVLTCPANEEMRPIHERMPVLLTDDGVAAWLGGEAATAELLPWLGPAPEGYLRSYPVGPLVNRSEFDGPEAIAPLS
jgi:putative SOS response-associated peptidase YedK